MSSAEPSLRAQLDALRAGTITPNDLARWIFDHENEAERAWSDDDLIGLWHVQNYVFQRTGGHITTAQLLAALERDGLYD